MAHTPNPFLAYRHRLDSYRAVAEGHLPDERFVELVTGLDEAVARVDGRGFMPTPLHRLDSLAEELAPGTGLELWAKDETRNVAGSHKARHLFGTAVTMLVDEELGAAPSGDGAATRLAIASCGNAALAAGVIAAALDRPLDVFVPTWADDIIVTRLTDLGATVTRCPRHTGEAGDPAYLRFREAVAGGSRSFSVQGTDTPSTFDGGRTLGWEIADALPGGGRPDDRLYLQVGGGALATATSLGMPEPRLFPVQTEGCAPLRRAWDRLAAGRFDFARAEAEPGAYMWPWEDEPTSAASGILDDVTYDWLPLLRRANESGGEPLVVAEDLIVQAHQLVAEGTDLAVSATGTAGLAGLLADLTGGHLMAGSPAGRGGKATGSRPADRHGTANPVRVIVAFTGVER